jgi:hypothetical protein
MAGEMRIRPSIVMTTVITLATVSALGATDWQPLAEAGRAVLGHHGTDVYADRPGIQTGPLSLVLYGVLETLGLGRGQIVVHVLLWATGLYALRLAGSAPTTSPTAVSPAPAVTVPAVAVGALALLPVLAKSPALPATGKGVLAIVLVVLLAAGCESARVRAAALHQVHLRPWHWVGLLIVGSWASLAAGTGHLDDGLAVLGLIAAVVAGNRDRRLIAAVAVGLAIAAKPWAVVGLATLLRRERPHLVIRDLAIATAIPLAAFAPFLLSAHGMGNATSAPFPISPVSTVHLFGLHALQSPSWLRSVQLVGALAAALLARRRGRADAIAAGMVVRLLLDPATYGYYTASAAIAVGAADVLAGRGAWRTALTTAGLWLVPLLTQQHDIVAGSRSLVLLVLLASYLGPVLRRRRDAEPPVATLRRGLVGVG